MTFIFDLFKVDDLIKCDDFVFKSKLIKFQTLLFCARILTKNNQIDQFVNFFSRIYFVVDVIADIAIDNQILKKMI